jgi:ectoine hydroxylase-related dioxygenase (phytanoyl-CoA dioxygenase family)
VHVEGSLEAFPDLGYAIISDVLGSEEIGALLTATNFEQAGATHQRGGQAYANRQALLIPEVVKLATSFAVTELASAVLAKSVFSVRAILFDKVVGANWKIPWHQDITIPVVERIETDGYRPWSTKDGSPHVQAPSRVLQNMVAIRLHLDDCGSDNGPVRVVPGSHRLGRINKSEIPSLCPDAHSRPLICKKGDAIAMSPLTVHASSPASSPNHRRVIHIEFASCELDAPLQWARRV